MAVGAMTVDGVAKMVERKFANSGTFVIGLL